MRIYIVFILLVIINTQVTFASQSSLTDTSKTRTELLTGNSSKNWMITSGTCSDSVCSYPNDFSGDNSFTFFVDGKFSFDPGAITLSNDSTMRCSDPEAFSGAWEFLNNESNIVFNSITEDGSLKILAEGKVIFSSESEFVIEIVANFSDCTFTFTKK